jgi:adenylate kinase
MPLNLFIIGPSGSGKSTQAKLIAQKYNLTHFSMGQLLRDEIATSSRLGIDAKVHVDDGTPVPDDIVLPILSEKLKNLNYQNFIIDGFPRLVNQGHYIDCFLVDKGQQSTLLIHLLVDFEEIVRRRQKAGQQFQNDVIRTDNTPEAIANRQKILYESNVNPVLEYYRTQNKLFEVDGNRPIEPIFEDICNKIDKFSTNA